MGKAIIFLDIDGVLATHKQYMMNQIRFHYNYEWASDLNVPYPYDEKCVKVFNEILEKTDADIVLSSDWRLRWDLEQIDKIFKANNIIKSPIDVTEHFPYGGIQLERWRAGEIDAYINKHNVENWIIIDDLNMKQFFPNDVTRVFVTTDSEGIKKSSVKDKIIRKLKSYETSI
jgi:hypothetical protein